MTLRFTKMQGAGNDVLVLDATQAPIALTPAQFRRLADRRYGVGADQVLIVERSTTPGIDFRYRIVNADGGEVEHCGNGARCFLRYVLDKGLTTQPSIRVETVNRQLVLRLRDDGQVVVDMGLPEFALARIPFDATGLQPERRGDGMLWPLRFDQPSVAQAEVAVLSMGNPHAVHLVADVDRAPVAELGPLIEGHRAFPQRVNAGFLQVIGRDHVRLRVYERGAGETLACGTGACAAVVAGIRLGLLGPVVEVDMRGGRLRVEWQGASVLLSGPAETVFEGEITL